MSRAFLFVLDSFGIGGAPDAKAFGDEGSNTFGHIVEACAAGARRRAGLRSGPLHLPNMRLHSVCSTPPISRRTAVPPRSRPLRRHYGVRRKKYRDGKDTPSGHWEIAGVPVTFNWGYFPQNNSDLSRQSRCRCHATCKTTRHPRQQTRIRDGYHR